MARDAALFEYLLRLGDSALVLGHRLSEWCGHAPMLEEDLALANMGLDLIGQARLFYAYAGEHDAQQRDEDQLAYLRDAPAWRNLLLCEQPNGDFAVTMLRQFLFAAYAEPLYRALSYSADPRLAEIAAKAEKEMLYHRRHAGDWVIRLGDGTQESHDRLAAALELLWPFTGEMFELDAVEEGLIARGMAVDPGRLKDGWRESVSHVLHQATLPWPTAGWMQSGGRSGRHSEYLGRMLAEMQFLPRAYPGATW